MQRSLTSQRLPEKMRKNRQALDELLNSTVLAHVGVMLDGAPVVFPTGFALIDDHLVIHGSTGSRWMRAIVGQECAVTITKLDAIVVARSTFESSMQYRSAMIFGRFVQVEPDRKGELVKALSDRFIPGRSAEVRPSTKRELAATMVLALPIDSWSLRVSEDWPDDNESDRAGDAWAGIVAVDAPRTRIEPAPDLRSGIPVPASVRNLADHPECFV